MAKFTKDQERARDESRALLREWLAPVSTERKTVYTINRHTSRSGMCRRLDFYLLTADGPRYLTGHIANALLGWYTRHRGGSLNVGGCGMDMGFSVVYSLGSVLWPTGTSEPHGRRNAEPDSTGGYAIRHEWL